jgi:MFS family permease
MVLTNPQVRTALQPFCGQLANVFGRRWPMIVATTTFVLGSGICGGASNMAMLIAGRVIQGAGAGGIGSLVEIILCDLVPLRQRGNYLALIFGLIAVGTALGPFFGGLIVEDSTWRWVFYLNLPIGSVALVLLVVFLKVRWNKDVSYATKLTSIDWVGNIIFIAAICSILIALSWAGAVYPWTSYRILVPLIVGLVGLAGFLAFEGSRFAPQPSMPLHLMSNRTSATVYMLSLLHSIVTMWSIYFLPVYFQGVLGSTPAYSGVQLLPSILVLIPFAAMGGAGLSKFGRYRPLHSAGFALIVVSFGLFGLLDWNSSTGAWVGYQMLGAAGIGLVIPTLLPAVMAPLSDSDTALATSTWAFLRTFGLIWGTAIPAAIFNNRFDELATTGITDPVIRGQLVNGQAYGHATAAFLNTLSASTREEFISVLNESLRRAWQVGVGFAALGFLLTFLEKEIPLRQDLETEFGMETGENKKKASEEEAIAK